MAKQEYSLLAFNRGIISDLGLARVDLKRSALSAEDMTNWMPRALGSMMLRPGLGYIGATNGNAATRCISFVKKRSDTAILEFTNAAMRAWVDDVLITRPSVSTVVTNGDFTTNLTGWTDNDEGGATSAWIAALMGLTGTGTNGAIRDQQVSVAVADRNVEHALRIVITRGPVLLRVGSTSGGDEYITEGTLNTGTHSLSFTPTGDFHIRFMSRLARLVLVDSCNVEGAGVMSITSPYLTADLDNIRGGWDTSQSADVMYLGCDGYQQRKIERRGNARSWAIVLYQAPDGPFRAANAGPITMTPSTLNGNGTLTASKAFFRSTHVGALFSVTSTGQTVTKSMTAVNDSTPSIRVTGVGAPRTFTIAISGLTATGNTVILQQSFDNSTWAAVAGYSWVADNVSAYGDGLDNQIVYYRLRCSVYAGGTTVAILIINTGSIVGVARVLAFTSSTVVDMEVLTDFGDSVASDDWREGEWSDFRGWPTAVGFYEGRLGWAGRDKVWLSVTDLFDGFDDTTEGDSGPISRSIGSGPVAVVNWMLPLQRIILGGEGAEYSVRSSAFDDPLTPSSFNIKPASTQGSAPVNPVRIDSNGMFVQGGGTRVFEMAFSAERSDYVATDLTLLVPEIGGDIDTTVHIVRMAVQRQPDTRIHCVRSDGTAVVLVYDKAENVLCWVKVDSTGASGLIEDVVTLPAQSGQREDQVYYVVKRTVNGSTVRYLEKWALESECLGSTWNKQADAFVYGTQTASTTISGLSHLAGATVICWHDGVCEEDSNGDIQTYVVSGGGTITVDSAATYYVVGLAYESSWKGAKLGQSLNRRKQINHVAVILDHAHPKGLRFGPSLTDSEMDYLPLVSQGYLVDTDAIYSKFDEPPIPFPGTWDTDSRLCLKASAPRPCTILAAVVDADITA